MRTERVIAYIDGFNLYHGLCDAQLESSRWLDLRGVCESLLKPHQKLVLVRYFTSMVRNKPKPPSVRAPTSTHSDPAED